MSPTLELDQIGLRLVLAVVSATLIGANRSEHGRPVGLRTVLLVCIAAAVSMIQVNLLLSARGRTPDSFIMMDLMRLPLGILTGMGFIGAGAILRRGESVVGVTTAATLWLVTVIGLAYGGGQLTLGAIATGLGLIVLSGLKWTEGWMVQDRYAVLTITTEDDESCEEEIRRQIIEAGLQVSAWDVTECHARGHRRCTVRSRVVWRAPKTDTTPPEFVRRLSARPGVLFMNWKTT